MDMDLPPNPFDGNKDLEIKLSEEVEEATANIKAAITNTVGVLPKVVKDLAERLGDIHGVVRITQEASGIQLYIPCPHCLETKGRKEIKNPHLSISAGRALSLGEFASVTWGGVSVGAAGHDPEKSAWCMRHNTTDGGGGGSPYYTLTELLTMPNLKERGFEDIIRKVSYMDIKEREAYLVDDGRGNLIPPPPGVVTRIRDLPFEHPVHAFLRYRDLDPELLTEQFDASFCTKEYPSDKEMRILYRKLSGGWKDTPQGRLIFNGDQFGIRQGWQARYLEVVSDDNLRKLVWHPYYAQWEVSASRVNPYSPWIPQGHFTERDGDGDIVWQPSKYKTATHSLRNHILLGMDAALRNIEKSNIPYVVVSEGPGDSAKFGPGGVALTGKFMSDMQANLIAQSYELVILAFDNDSAGRDATERAKNKLAQTGEILHIEEFHVPREFKDPGDMAQADVLGDLEVLLNNY